MLGTFVGAAYSWHKRGLLVEAALLSEAFELATPVKLRVAAHYQREGIMPGDNNDLGLPPPKSVFGTSVKRVAVNRGGVLIVDFEDRIGERAMTFTPAISSVGGLLNWNCTSDSVDRAVLELLKPECIYHPATDASHLMHAIANEDAPAVDSWLQAGVDPDSLVNGNTPLMLAAKIGDTDIVNSLIVAGATIEKMALGSERRSPLMVAITSNNAGVVAYLLSKGASVATKDYRGMSAMDHAIVTDQRLGGEQFAMMVSASSSPRFTSSADITVSALVDKKAENKRMRALYQEYRFAADTCHAQRLSSLLSAEDELSTNEMVNGVALLETIRRPECAQILAAHLQTKDSYVRSARAHLADRVQRCDVTGVARTLDDNPALDVMHPHIGSSPLELSVNAGCYSVLRLMVREQNLTGKLDEDIIVRAIARAPQQTLLKLVGNLIAAEANVNGVDQFGQSPLAVAIAMEQPVVAKFLLDAGASLNQKTSNGSYPVIEATKKGYEHLALQMVSDGANLNARDQLGRTALFAAVSRGQPRLVQALIQAGANIRITDSNGINPVVLAESHDHKLIKSLLIASID